MVRHTGFGVTQSGLKIPAVLPTGCEVLGSLFLCVSLLLIVCGANDGTHFMGFM